MCWVPGGGAGIPAGTRSALRDEPVVSLRSTTRWARPVVSLRSTTGYKLGSLGLLK
jgi:hypothetical protein